MDECNSHISVEIKQETNRFPMVNARPDQLKDAQFIVLISGHGTMSKNQTDNFRATTDQEKASRVFFCVREGIEVYDEQAKAIEEEIIRGGKVIDRTFYGSLLLSTSGCRKHTLY
jgi:hypothetical protein